MTTHRRPRSLTGKVTARIVEAIAGGASVKDACRLAGIDRGTHYKWLRLARSPDCPRPIFRKYADAVEEAETAFKVQAVADIVAVGRPWTRRVETVTEYPDGRRVTKTTTETRPGDWRATSWLLQARHPDEYGNRVAVEHEVTETPRRVELRIVAPDGRRMAVKRDAGGRMTCEDVDGGDALPPPDV